MTLVRIPAPVLQPMIVLAILKVVRLRDSTTSHFKFRQKAFYLLVVQATFHRETRLFFVHFAPFGLIILHYIATSFESLLHHNR